MLKDIKKITDFHKSVICGEVPETFELNHDFLYGLDQNDARNGLISFRRFLFSFFDYINENSEAFSPVIKTVQKKNGTEEKENFVLLRDLFQALLRIGMESRIGDENGFKLYIDGGNLSESFHEARMTRIKDCLIHLTKLGFDFGEIGDFTKKAYKLPTGKIIVSYHDDCNVLTGLKIMAEANKIVHPSGASRPTGQILLRCDYSAIGGKRVKSASRKVLNVHLNIDDCLGFLPDKDKKAILEISSMLTENGYKYEGKMINLGFCFAYTSKKNGNVLMTIWADMDGCKIKVNADNINSYINVVKTFPSHILHTIKESGWDCAKKHDPNACNPKCKGGFKYTFDGVDYDKCRGGSFCLGIKPQYDKDVVIKWLENEIITIY